ncbi:MAG: cupin domain-containing protein [Acidobacteria bacterium]|nr:cupin domain-containing protein [Acidobacteriota bacterium]
MADTKQVEEKSATIDFPDIITQLPEIDIHFPGVRGWLLQGGDHQIGFFDYIVPAEAEEHTHGAQWGVIVDGEMELTIGGVTKVYQKGDTYFIPEGVPHGARWTGPLKSIDYFDDRGRYKVKSEGG